VKRTRVRGSSADQSGSVAWKTWSRSSCGRGALNFRLFFRRRLALLWAHLRLVQKSIFGGQDAHGPSRCGQDAHGPSRCGQDAHGPSRCGQDAHGPSRCGQDVHGPSRCGQDAHGPSRCGQDAHAPFALFDREAMRTSCRPWQFGPICTLSMRFSELFSAFFRGREPNRLFFGFPARTLRRNPQGYWGNSLGH